MDAILPPLPPDELKSTFKTLLASNHIQYPYTDNPRWTCLPRDPRTSKQPEHKTFKFLEEITKAIEESHLLESQEWVTLSITGKVTPVSFRHNTSRPDGFIHFKHPSSTPVEWANIILAMEFKNKYDKNKNTDAMAKVIWSMHHIMRNDARRRHISTDFVTLSERYHELEQNAASKTAPSKRKMVFDGVHIPQLQRRGAA
ncbi:hypothetical protein RSAG8_11171, partial [Rhizoctonia solani AG-8 WAC10335]